MTPESRAVRQDDRSPAAERAAPLLETSGLGVVYSNGAQGIFDIAIELPRRTIVAILGRNGAGKTSLLRSIAGFLHSERVTVHGSVRFKGREIRSMSPVGRHKSGIVFVSERDKVFPSLTVEEHLRLVGSGGPRPDTVHGFEALAQRWTSRAGLLSGGERQMLALAMAWEQQADLLLVDELSLGLAPVITKDLLQRLRQMTETRQICTIVVEQDAAAALRIADHVYVLDRGGIVWEGPSTDTSASELSERYLGSPR